MVKEYTHMPLIGAALIKKLKKQNCPKLKFEVGNL
jgi:hypothetical protein